MALAAINGVVLYLCGLSILHDWQAWVLIGWFILAGGLIWADGMMYQRRHRPITRFNDFPSHDPVYELSWNGGKTWEPYDPFAYIKNKD